jgi:hypothetical protein
MTNQETDFINDFLNPMGLNISRRSCLIMALKSARKHTGRDIKTGKDISGLINEDVFDNNLYHSEYFTGLAVYLILLEQIGLIFCKVGYKDGKKTNGIQIALENFSRLNRGQIKALRALRNSLAHNFGLALAKNPLSKTEEQLYKFRLHFDQNQEPISPNLNWHGNYNDKNDSTDTVVGVQQLCGLVENVFFELKSEFEIGNIELRIKDLNEIKARFTII